MKHEPPIDPELDLILTREVDVPPGLVWRAWTEPDLLMQWFTPAPWKTVACEIDLRPGGVFSTTMCSPEGEQMPKNDGCFLEVIPDQRLSWTDALLPDYRPSGGGFMTATILLEETATGTRYTAIARHARPEQRQQHEEMGFLQGWGTALEQLVALVKKGI